MSPAGGAVDGTGVAERFDERLDEYGRGVVALGPVLGQSAADEGKYVRAEAGNLDPGLDAVDTIVDTLLASR